MAKLHHRKYSCYWKVFGNNRVSYEKKFILWKTLKTTAFSDDLKITGITIIYMKPRLFTAIILGVFLGISIAYIDTRPHWDDTGITVGILLIAAFICGFISPQRTWLIALSVGIWIPLFNIIKAHNFGSLLALVPAFIGAYAGNLARNIFVTAKSK